MSAPKFRLQVPATTFVVVLVVLVTQTAARAISVSLMSESESFISIFAPAFGDILVGGLPLLLVFCLFLFMSLRPLHHAVNALERGEDIGASKAIKARRLITRLPLSLFVGNIVISAIAGSLNVLLNPQSLLRMEGLLQFATAVAAGMVVAAVQIGIDNSLLIRPRQVLGIHAITDEDRFVSIYRLRRVVTSNLTVFLMALVALTALDALRLSGEGVLLTERAPIALIVIIVYGAALASAVTYTAALGERRQIEEIQRQLDRLADRSIFDNEQIAITGFDEIGLLAVTVNRMIENQVDLISDIRTAAEKVVRSSQEVDRVIRQTRGATEKMSSSIEQVNATAEQNMASVNQTADELKTMLASVDRITEQVDTQASNVEQSSSAVTELAESVRSVTSTTERANKLAEESNRVASEGGEAVRSSLQSIHDIESASDQVNSIIGVISKISAQTNMLAMNAAIEAAHAGDAGRGFAVVAEEVRSLAAESAGSAREIGEHIKQMRSQVESGVARAEEAGKSLDHIQNDIAQTSELIAEIAAAMREQNDGTGELLSGISSLVESTESIRSVAREQKERNSTMRSALDELLSSFSEIERATADQAKGTKEIVEAFATLREVADENAAVVEQLQKISGGEK